MRVTRLTNELQRHDRQLVAEWHNENICIFRKALTHEQYDVDGQTIVYFKPVKHFLWALTKDWRMASEPADWGLEAIMAKVKESDLWHRDKLANELIKDYEKRDESNKREAGNQIEDFCHEFRPAFKKTFSDYNTSTLEKVDLRRKKDGCRKSYA